MEAELTPLQQAERARFRNFVCSELVPHADRFDREERLPPGLIQKLAADGYLAAAMPPEEGGLEPITYGLLHEEFGRACSSTRSLLTVHHMVTHAIRRWGSSRQKESVQPRLLRGERLAAFALTEPNAGSDASQVETEAACQRLLHPQRPEEVSHGRADRRPLPGLRAVRRGVAASLDAVQIHGAFGCSAESPVQRHMRDAKIMEIIEGSTQIQQIAIAQYAYVCGDS